MEVPRRLVPIVLALVLLAGACSSEGGASKDATGADADGTSMTEIIDLRVSENPNNVVSAWVEFETSGPATATITAVAPDHEVVATTDEPTEQHRVGVAGLRADRTYEVTVSAEAEGATAEPQSVDFATGSLPPGFPRVEVTRPVEGALAPGWTLFTTRLVVSDGAMVASSESIAGRPTGMLLALDEDGEVVWYVEQAEAPADAEVTAEGTVLYTYANRAVREVDAMGDLVNEWAMRLNPETAPDAIAVATDSAHHEASQLPNGNLLVLSTELAEVDSPEQLCADLDANPRVVADVVVEFDPDTGEVVKEWSLLDVFDPAERPGIGLCDVPPLYQVYPEAADAADWTHGNAAVLDADNNVVIVSSAHLDSIFALRYEDDEAGPAGELVWELGDVGSIVPDAEERFFHQHEPEVLDDGTLLVYDNGVGRVDAAGDVVEPPFSRAVQYRFDPAAGEVEQVWEFRRELDNGQPVYAAALGDVDVLPNGNRLIVDGVQSSEGAFLADVVEIDETGEVLRILRLTEPGGAWGVYRAELVEPLGPVVG